MKFYNAIMGEFSLSIQEEYLAKALHQDNNISNIETCNTMHNSITQNYIEPRSLIKTV